MKKDSSSSDAIKVPVQSNNYINAFKNMNDFEKIMNMWSRERCFE